MGDLMGVHESTALQYPMEDQRRASHGLQRLVIIGHLRGESDTGNAGWSSARWRKMDNHQY